MTEQKGTYGVLPNKLGGGPHGLGDPDDKTLRRVEMDVLVPKKMRDRAKAEKCTEEVKDFTRCCADSSFLMVVKCREENTALRGCLERWYNDEDFRAACTKEYLDERSEYRRTGIPLKDRVKKPLGSNRLPSSM